MGRETAALASLYLTHAAVGGLAGQQLDEAEKSYILWDWEGLAPLAYEQFLKFGRGAFIGPRTVVADDSVTVAFDYVPSAGGSLAKIVTQNLATSLGHYVDHYHPELDFIVIWLREDGNARYEVLRSDETQGLFSPKDLYELRPSHASARPN